MERFIACGTQFIARYNNIGTSNTDNSSTMQWSSNQQGQIKEMNSAAVDSTNCQ